MHIEPGLVDPAKMVLAYATAAGGAAVTAKFAWETIKEKGPVSLLARTGMATAAVFVFLRSSRISPSGFPKFTSSSAPRCF